MKKTLLIIVGTVLLAAGITISVKTVKSAREAGISLNANVAALADKEIEMPCVRATSVCNFPVKDADGNNYTAEATGFKNVE